MVLVFFGVTVLMGDPHRPYSSTIPLVIGEYQFVAGVSLILVGIIVGACVAIHIKNRKGEHGSENN